MGEVTGVFLCRCGGNIADKVDVDALERHFSGIGGNVVACTHNLLCAEEGKEFVEKEIREKGMDRIVLAACSPRQHEVTFRGVCEAAGLSPYMMQMANVREMCAWTTDDAGAATEKARLLVNAALERVGRHEPLLKRYLDVCPDAVVVGAGVAGISAALMLAQKGRKVTVVEKAPCVGGMAVRYEDVFPNLDCAPCMLEPPMDHLLHHDNIELLTNSEVVDVQGFYGNFIIKIRKKARLVKPDLCYGCNACFEPCPVSVKNEFNEGLDERKAIYIPFPGALPNVPVIDRENCLRSKGEECTKCAESCGFGAVDYTEEDEIVEVKAGGVVLATGFGLYDVSALEQYGYSKHANVVTSLEIERLISSTGPTGGSVEIGGESPSSAAIIHCVGSRTAEHKNYCSAICCQNSLKLGHLLRKKLEGVEVTHFYTDWCLPGKEPQRFYDRVKDEGSKFVQVADAGKLKVSGEGNELTVTEGRKKHGTFGLVVLVPALVPSGDAGALSEMFSVDLDADGFYSEAHNRMSASATNTEGVFVAGCAQGPKDIQSSVNHAQAAAGKILAALVPGEQIELEAATASISEGMCSGCMICNSMCPYKAISYDEAEKISRINEVLCHGCGVCVASCPSGAITQHLYTKEQIMAEIAGVLS